MKLITRDTDYAIRAVCYLAKHKKVIISANELAKYLKMPRPFLRRILQLLGKKEIVKSYKGQGGGFSLSISPHKLSLLDIITAFQGPIMLNDHTFKKRMCPCIKNCKVKKKLDLIEKFMILKLK